MKLNTDPNPTDIPTNPDIKYSEDVKQSEYAVTCLLFQSIKYNFSSELLRSEMQSLGVFEDFIDDFLEVFEVNKQALLEKSMMVGHGFPVVNDVSWKLQTQVKGPNETQTDFKINFGDEIEFLCNKEELQKLISQLKEVERHCENLTK